MEGADDFSLDLLTSRRRKKRGGGGTSLYKMWTFVCVSTKENPTKKKKKVFFIFGRGRAVMEDQREYRSHISGKKQQNTRSFSFFLFPRLSSIREWISFFLRNIYKRREETREVHRSGNKDNPPPSNSSTSSTAKNTRRNTRPIWRARATSVWPVGYNRARQNGKNQKKKKNCLLLLLLSTCQSRSTTSYKISFIDLTIGLLYF